MEFLRKDAIGGCAGLLHDTQSTESSREFNNYGYIAGLPASYGPFRAVPLLIAGTSLHLPTSGFAEQQL